MNQDFLFKNEEKILRQVIEFFFASVLKKEHFEEVMAACLKNPEVAKTNRRHFVQKGQFSLKDFLYYWGSVLNPTGGVVPNVIIEELLRRFCACHLLHRSELLLSYGLDYYQVNEPLAKFFLERDALENLAFDISHLAEKYANSILHLAVTDKSGDRWSGTGFVFVKKDWVLTNKHVVEEDVNHSPRVLLATGQELVIRKVQLSPSNDLALLELASGAIDARPIFPFGDLNVLDEIVTMGYPRIPFAKTATMVAHKGEINGHARLMHGDRLIFSAKTAPGNSGGPLMNRAGLVVGIVTEELQSEMAAAKNVQPYFSAIPIVQVIDFIKEILSVGLEAKPSDAQAASGD